MAHGMLSSWHMAKPLTKSMEKALELARRNGAVFAGKGNESSPGGYWTVSASTVRALAARGLLTLSRSADDNLYGRPVVCEFSR